jgi:hypothetical protein
MKYEILGASVGIGAFITILLINGVISGLLWPYSINSWLVFFGKTPVIQFWHGFILGFVPWIGKATIPVYCVGSGKPGKVQP